MAPPAESVLLSFRDVLRWESGGASAMVATPDPCRQKHVAMSALTNYKSLRKTHFAWGLKPGNGRVFEVIQRLPIRPLAEMPTLNKRDEMKEKSVGRRQTLSEIVHPVSAPGPSRKRPSKPRLAIESLSGARGDGCNSGRVVEHGNVQAVRHSVPFVGPAER